ncbi:hypothetical protein NW754_004631 [Fusarium falciforme]|nr:hypothetical protein NW754_004631 [Fusarium falciforme]
MTPSLQDAKVCFVGGGNMAAAIIGGLLAKNISKQNIYVSEPWEVNRNKMAETGVKTTADTKEASADADIVILAVKPQVAKTVCEELGAAWSDRESLPVVISIAAGITLTSIAEWFKQSSGRAPHIVRVMPNTPALVGEGASGLKATEWVEKEELLDVVTGLSVPPASVFLEEQATRLAKQTCFGAGKMLVESSEEPAQLRKNVTSPNGTTHAALVSFENSGLKAIVDGAVKAATSRAEELGKN